MRILVVEDDPRLAELIASTLRAENYAVDVCGDGEEAAFLGETGGYDAVVLDLGLPGRSGLSVLGDWRGAGIATPVLVLTARDSWSDKVRGFRAGADDFVVKPARLEEIALRLGALIRRSKGHAASVVRCGPLVFDAHLSSFTIDGMALRLTAFETRLLAYLVLARDRVVSRTELSEHLYDGDVDRGFNSIEVIIGRLRRKMSGVTIETVRGLGYRLSAAEAGS